MQNGGVILYKASSDEKLVICLTNLEGEPGQEQCFYLTRVATTGFPAALYHNRQPLRERGQ